MLAQLFSEAFHFHAVHHHAAAQICHAELVLPSNRLLRLIHRGVVHLQAGVARQLQLRTLVDEFVQHGLGQLCGAGHGLALLHQHLLHALHFTHHFLVGDGLGIDHRHNKVGLAGFQLLKGWWQGANGRAPLAQAQTLRLQARQQTHSEGKHPNGFGS